MFWVPLGVVIGGVVLAIILFSFGAYELTWKSRRLRADLVRLETLNERLGTLQRDIAVAAGRLADSQQVMTERGQR